MGDTLYEGQTLTGNQALTSRNGIFRAVMQTDNNFVVYKQQGAIWDSKTCNRNGNNGRLILQQDNNLVVYDQMNSAIWSSGTNGRGGGGTNAQVRLVMQDDGNLVLYDQNNQPLWASNTCGR
jgi:hypothetical protein